MMLEGIVQNGVIVPTNGTPLPEGTRVRIMIEPDQTLPEVEAEPGKEGSLRDVLMKFAGCMTGLPPDMAEQHDHYIHGTPKR